MSWKETFKKFNSCLVDCYDVIIIKIIGGNYDNDFMRQ